MLPTELNNVLQWEESQIKPYELREPPFIWNDEGFLSIFETSAIVDGSKGILKIYISPELTNFIEHKEVILHCSKIIINEPFYLGKTAFIWYSKDNISPTKENLFIDVKFAKLII